VSPPQVVTKMSNIKIVKATGFSKKLIEKFKDNYVIGQIME